MVSLEVVGSVPHGFPCVTNLGQLKNNTETVLALVQEGQFVEALHLLETTLNDTYTNCGAAAAEGRATFESFLALVKDPNFLALAEQRIEENSLTLLDDLALTLENLHNQSYFNAGVAFGKIPHLVLSGPNAFNMFFLGLQSNGTPAVDFARGYLEAIQVMVSVPDGEVCANDVLSLKTQLDQVVELLKEFRILEAIQLLKSTLQNDLTSCTAANAEALKLFQDFLANVKQPGFAELAIGRVKDNLLTIFEDIAHGTGHVNSSDFYDAGKDFGHITHLILSGPDA